MPLPLAVRLGATTRPCVMFNEAGLAVLKRGSTRPHQLRTQIPDDQLPALKTLLHRSPRDFGFQSSLWTVPLVAKVAFQLGLCARPISGTSLRRALKRFGVNWKRAKHWIPSPDWAIGYLDEVWWLRFALPQAHAWQDEQDPLDLVEQQWQKDDPDPKALACYGVLWHRDDPCIPLREQMWLRFVDGRPVSGIPTQFLDWCGERLLMHDKHNWLLIWENASRHLSKLVRSFIREHNQRVKESGKGVRLLPFFLPYLLQFFFCGLAPTFPGFPHFLQLADPLLKSCAPSHVFLLQAFARLQGASRTLLFCGLH